MTSLAAGVLAARALPEGRERNAALWALTMDHRRVAYRAAHRCRHLFTDRADARQEAILALHRALSWWDPRKDLGIHTATRWFLLGSARLEFRCGLSISTDALITAGRMRRVEGWRITAGLPASPRHVAEEVGVDPAAAPTLLWATAMGREGALLDIPGGKIDGLDGFEPSEDPREEREAGCDLAEVARLVATLDPVEQAVIRLWAQGDSLREIGQKIASLRRRNPSEVPLSRERVRGIERSAMFRLRESLGLTWWGGTRVAAPRAEDGRTRETG